MTNQVSYVKRAIVLISGSRFFWGVTALLVVQAAWIALTGRYPMAFDEDFHLGIIRLYSHHLSPFLNSQPPGANIYGAVARDPSYLYHYLMSFPYRLINVFTRDLTIQVLLLRAINIGLFAWGLILYRRLLMKTGASSAIINVCLLVMVLIPVAPLLAAQINYDNLMLPLTALSLLWATEAVFELKTRKQINALLLMRLAIICILTSLVKYAFLPVFAVIAIYLTVTSFKAFNSWRAFYSSLANGMRGLRSGAGIGLAAGLTISLLLFGQRYGVNIVRYHTPIPDCSKVLGAETCEAYGPWERDHSYSLTKTSPAHNPVLYAGDWLYGMWLRLMFAVSGPATDFQTRGPFIVPAVSAIVFTAGGIILVAIYGRRVFRQYNSEVLFLMVLASAFYVIALWLDEFRAFSLTGQPVAVNGRYLFPVLPPLLLLGALAANQCLRGLTRLKLLVGTVAVLSLLWGGGALTYILRSNDAWYWPNSAVYDANHAVMDILGPVTPGYRSPGQFLR